MPWEWLQYVQRDCVSVARRGNVVGSAAAIGTGVGSPRGSSRGQQQLRARGLDCLTCLSDCRKVPASALILSGVGGGRGRDSRCQEARPLQLEQHASTAPGGGRTGECHVATNRCSPTMPDPTPTRSLVAKSHSNCRRVLPICSPSHCRSCCGSAAPTPHPPRGHSMFTRRTLLVR